jgi:DNA-binding transcriptional LysR family regulator
MHHTFAQLEAFYWVARTGGFRAAAARLHLTQPTVSQRVRDLEAALGCTLFDRGGYRGDAHAQGDRPARSGGTYPGACLEPGVGGAGE